MNAAYIGGMAATGAMQGGFGILSSYLNNKWAEKREKAARKENFEYGEMSANAADARTRALYRDLQSPEALLQQYRAAGLSPSLMFGGGGIGGQTTQGAQGAGAAGISPTTYGIPPIDFAQIKLMESEANKNNAEADRLNGNNERGKAEISEILERTNNFALKNAWQEYENALQEINLTKEASTYEQQIKNYFVESDILLHRLTSARVKATIDEETENDVKNYMREQVLNLMADTFLKRSEKALNEEKITLTGEQVEDLISQITTREEQLQLNKETLSAQVDQWCKENGLTERTQNIKIAEIVTDFFDHGMDRGADLLRELIPTNGKKTIVRGLQ